MVFLNLVAAPELLFGKGNAIIADKRARTRRHRAYRCAACRADFLAKNTDVKRVWVSNPSWPNHKRIHLCRAGVREYAYYAR